MRIYYHPASTTSRPLMLFASEAGLDVDFRIVDLFTGEHYKQPFEAINPNHLVPVLEDGDFRLTESSAILKYLADKSGLDDAYPGDLKARARVNERMDWVNTQLNRDLCYGLVYPQLFPHHKRPTEEAQKATLAWARERAAGWMTVLDTHLLGQGDYLCGARITIADYYAAPFVALNESLGSDLSAFGKVKRWLGRMKELKSWKKVNEAIDGFVATLKGPFERV